jgi:hypothetical protein
MIGFSDSLELLFRAAIPRIAIRMKAQGQLAKAALDFL